MCRVSSCGPPYPFEMNATIQWAVYNVEDPSSGSSTLEMRFFSSTDSSCASFDAAAASTLKATASAPDLTIPRGESTCNPWGAITTWAVYEPKNLCSHECVYLSDGDCDDGGPGAEYYYCNQGSDCEDCGFRAGEDRFFGHVSIHQNTDRYTRSCTRAGALAGP